MISFIDNFLTCISPAKASPGTVRDVDENLENTLKNNRMTAEESNVP